MSFLAPAIAGFAVATAIPILIHLLNKSRFRTVAWGAMDFLLKTLQQNKKRLQLRDMILMILRSAAILLAALALARPSLSSGLAGMLGSQSSTVIVLDTSLSMGATTGAGTRLDAARTLAKAAASESGRGAACALVLLSDIATSELTEPTRDLGFITGAIERATAADGGTRIVAGLEKARDLLATASGRKQVVLITDLQASGWSAADDPAWKQVTSDLATAGAELVIADPGHGQLNHVGIDRVATDDDLVTVGDQSEFAITLRNHGIAPASNVAVELYIGAGADPKNEPKKVASTVVTSLAAGATAQARLSYRFTAPGVQRITVRISSDALPNDHQRHLVIDVLDRLPVLVVDGTPVQQNQWTGGDFLRAALSPVASGGPNAAAGDDDSHGTMAVTRVTPAELGATNLERYRAVIISDLEAPSAALADALAARVHAGMGLILLPGAQSKIALWQQFLGERAKLLPATIGAQRDVKANGGLALGTDHLDHPVVSFFTDAEHRPFWAAPRFQRALTLTVPANDTAVRTVASFADGTPYIVERVVGTGSVLLFAAPLDRAWSDLPLRPAFVMAMTRAVQHVALGWTSRQARQTNQPLTCEVPARFGRAQLKVRAPDGTIAGVTPVPGAGNTLRAEVVNTGRSGFYRLWAENPQTELGLFAVNPPPEESDLATLTNEQAQARLGGLKAGFIGGDEDAAGAMRRARAGIELWPWLLGVALACLVAEMFLAQHWAPRDAGRSTT